MFYLITGKYMLSNIFKLSYYKTETFLFDRWFCSTKTQSMDEKGKVSKKLEAFTSSNLAKQNMLK